MSTTLQTEQTGRSRKKFFFGVAVAAAILLGYLAFRMLWGLLTLGYVDSAIVRVRAISAAEDEFAKAHPEGYTCVLSQLPSSKEVARLLIPGGIDNGYAFEIVGCRAEGPGKPDSTYHITARPLRSGLPAFCTDQSGVLKSGQSGSVEECVTNGVSW